MSNENKVEQSRPEFHERSSTPGSTSKTVDYAKWIGMVATFLSIFLAFKTYGLDAQRRHAEAALEGSKKSQDRLSAKLEEIKGKVEIDSNFYFEGAATAANKFRESTSTRRLFTNEVYSQVLDQMKRGRWSDLNNLMRCVYGFDPRNPNSAVLNSRQILYFEIFYNPSSESRKPPAQKLAITYRYKDFSPLPEEGSLARQFSFNELNAQINTWQSKTLEIGDLKSNGKIIIPIAHMVGPYTFSERLIIPTKLSWYNPLLSKNEEQVISVANAMSELDAKSQGFLLGNTRRSCGSDG
jgi:hypothetical protein